jgi:hypothetical protein
MIFTSRNVTLSLENITTIDSEKKFLRWGNSIAENAILYYIKAELMVI